DLLAQTTCALRSSAAGRVTFLSVTQLDISATKIREACKNNKSVRFLLPDSVCHYIQKHGLYS
ncbi:MAG TPA: nicotinic acid mononucleotide adenylyltransferase, partial [Thiolinea sp.]|nr:nicotinic acid mononucleotide adenylyltransferase [Thiolinea sp.]